MSGNFQYEREINAVVGRLNGVRNVLFVTGAGVSADSGLPTYRGIGGLYDTDDTEDGIPIEEALSARVFRSNPELSWKYLWQIGQAARAATFNRAHEVIALMERRFDRVWTLTQNIDGYHRQAGSKNLIEIHGSMDSLSCTGCHRRLTADELTEVQLPPRCPGCSSILRPDVVLFGEMLPDKALLQLRQQMEIGFELVFSVGTSSVFPYIIEPVIAASRARIPTVEINPARTTISPIVDYRIPLGAAEALDRIWSLLGS